jgi:hypothetical protein
MHAADELRRALGSANDFNEGLALEVLHYLVSQMHCQFSNQKEHGHFESLFSYAEQIHPGFRYLCWRQPDSRFRCSLALDEYDMDRHSWIGEAATPSLALASALLASLPERAAPADGV